MFRLIANVLAILSLSLPAGRAIPAETSESFRDAASTDQNFRPVGAHLTLGAALQIAEAFARQKDIAPSAYKAPLFSYHCEKDEDCGWAFLYAGKVVSLNPMVFVNDRTQIAELWPRFVDGK